MPIDVKQWAKLTSEERKILIELTEKYNKNPDYLELMYASPFIIKDKGQTLVLLPEPSSDGTYNKWVLINDQDKVIKRNISGDSTLDGDPISSGYTNGATDDLKRVYDISDLEIEESDSKSLDEIKVNKPLPSIKLNFPNIATVNLDNWNELNKVIETIAKLNPKIPEDIFYVGSVVADVADYKNGPTVPFKDFLKSYFYWLARNLFYELNYDEENEQGNVETPEQHNEQERFAENASNGRWLIIPGISDFKNPISEIQINKPGKRKWTNETLHDALRNKGMDLNAATIWDESNETNISLETYEVYNEEEVLKYIKSLGFKIAEYSTRQNTIPSVHGGYYYEWYITCENPNPEKPEIRDGNDLWELIKPEFELDIKELLDEIQVKKPNMFKSLVKSYTKYLESISRAEMFDESGNYNSTLKDYHNKLKDYAINGTEKEQEVAGFILSWI